MSDELVIAGRAFGSRLIVGTGKYRSFQEMARAHLASGADMVTVAVRRVNLTDRTRNRCSITSTARRFSSCRIRPDATPRTKRSAPRGSAGKWACPTG